jgi:hypothetical protein
VREETELLSSEEAKVKLSHRTRCRSSVRSKMNENSEKQS